MPTKKFKTKHAPGLIAQWGPRRDLNPHPDDYKSSALPFALRGHKWRRRVSHRCGAGDFLFLHNYYKNIMCYCIFQGLDLFAPIFILFQFLFLIDSFCTQFFGFVFPWPPPGWLLAFRSPVESFPPWRRCRRIFAAIFRGDPDGKSLHQPFFTPFSFFFSFEFGAFQPRPNAVIACGGAVFSASAGE